MTTLDRLRWCGKWVVPGKPGVLVLLGADGHASFGNVQTCGLVWACPVCSAKIRHTRSVELEGLALGHVRSGGGLEFATMTVRHSRADRLKPMLRSIAKGWTRLLQSRTYRWMKADCGVIGLVRAVEITWTERNGWHPHLHCLLFTDRPITDDQRAELHRRLASAWADCAEKEGAGRPDLEHGCRVQPVRGSGGAQALSGYLTKVQDGFDQERSVGAEMTRADLKRGKIADSYTPFGILERALLGEEKWLHLWWEYEQATKGRAVLTWSQGLRDRLGAGAEVDDETVAEAAAEAEVVGVLGRAEWAVVVKYRAECRLLDAVELEGAAGLLSVMRALRRRVNWEAKRLSRSSPARAG